MLKFVLLCVALSGLQAVPIMPPAGLGEKTLPDGYRQGTEPSFYRLPSGFQQGTEPSRRFLVDLDTGLIKEYVSQMDRAESAEFVQPLHGQGFGEMERRHWLVNKVPAEVPVQRSGSGWVRVEEPSTFFFPGGFRQGAEPMISFPDGFRQGTEPMISLPDGFRQGTEPMISLPDGFRQGTEPMMAIPEDFRQGTEPMMAIPDGFRQGTEPMISLPDGFRQGTEPMMTIPEGFRQGTEPMMVIPDGFRQGTEPMISLTDGFRQGTEPMIAIPDRFRQGTKPMISLPEGYRQGSILERIRQETEPIHIIPNGFRQGTEPSTFSLPEGFKQGTEPSTSRLQTETLHCEGVIINGHCYQFNPTPLSFKDAQSSCRALARKAELASVTDADLHSRLVSMVTKDGKDSPMPTWLGGVIKNQQAEWVDGSEWGYSDWMPGHPNIHTDKPVCLEMFRIDESWWTAADCELNRASICSYPVVH